ncbi:MAG: DUF4910 domain-containing protein [Desulfovibrionaceae bacterium]
MNMTERLSQWLKLELGIAQPDNRVLMDEIAMMLPLAVHSYPSGMEHNGWIVPKSWIVHRAQIRKDGRLMFDGKAHYMAVAGHSCSFSGTVDKEELDRHVFYRTEHPDAYVYHNIYSLRPWETGWGFCIPYAQYSEWPTGCYEIDLQTERRDGEMFVGTVLHQGRSTETLVFNAHTCHPCQANDDLVGVLAIIELFQRLAHRETKYSYLGVFAPEILGTVFYTASLSCEALNACKAGVFAEMPGTRGVLSLQASFQGTTGIDRIARHAVSCREPNAVYSAFRGLIGNDETVWEAPGVDVPMVSLQRPDYSEYHTNKDDERCVDFEHFREYCQVLQDIVDVYEEDYIPLRAFKGLLCLSNPKYGLYHERKKAFERGKTYGEQAKRFGVLQNVLPQLMDGRHTVFDIAEKAGVSFQDAKQYIDKFLGLSLAHRHEVEGMGHYSR